MKEATGELSITAIAALAIGAIALIFTTLILPMIRSNLKQASYCASAFGCNCQKGAKTCACHYYDETGALKDITCANNNN